ncbi:MAG: O-antigen ligase family protein [Candidatus Kerfeldbacteria bacterium]|nr:O-antigen ligase family protein [Candidatus Kerfeldbacteria bacterium]
MTHERIRAVLRWGVMLCVFLLPWQTRWIWRTGRLAGGHWEYGTLGIAAVDILLVILLVTALLMVRQRAVPFTRAPRFWVVAAALLVVVTASSFIAKDTGLALFTAATLVEGLALVWLWMVVRATPADAAWSIGGAAVLQGIVSLGEFWRQQVPAEKWLGLAAQDPADAGTSVIETTGGRFLRGYGSLHPIVLAGLLAAALLLVLTWIVVHRGRRAIPGQVAAPFIMLGLILTFSRIGWISVAVGVATLIILVRATIRDRLLVGRTWAAAALTAVTMAAFALVFAPLVTTRLQGSARLEQISIAERNQAFDDATALISDTWYRGVGAGNTTLAIADLVAPGRKSYGYQPPNSLPIVILTELGVVGLILFLWVVVETVRMGIRAIGTRRDTPRVWAIGSLAAFFALLFTGLFDHTLWTLHAGALFFWWVVGVVLQGTAADESP